MCVNASHLCVFVRVRRCFVLCYDSREELFFAHVLRRASDPTVAVTPVERCPLLKACTEMYFRCYNMHNISSKEDTPTVFNDHIL